MYGNYAPFYRPGYFNPTPMAETQNQFAHPYQMPMQAPQNLTDGQMTASAPANDMIWVLSETEAESYPVAPNTRIVMWDKNRDTVYIKSANAQGVPSMEILDYVKRDATQKAQVDFVKHDEFKELQAKFEDLNERFNTLSTKDGKK